MKRLRKLPSPALVLSIVALVAAISGVAAALPGKNSVDSGDIKNNSVKTGDVKNENLTGTDVKKGTIAGSDVKDNSITGTDVNESTLGPVPSLQGHDAILAKLTNGQSQTLATNGAVSIVATCEIGVDVDPTATTTIGDRVRLLAATTQDGAVMDGSTDHNGGALTTDYLNAATPPDERVLLFNTTDPSGTTNVDNDIDDGFVLGPDGHGLAVNGEGWALGLNFLGSACVVGGHIDHMG